MQLIRTETCFILRLVPYKQPIKHINTQDPFCQTHHLNLKDEMSHYNHPIYQLNDGFLALQDPLPLPPESEDLPVKINTYEDVDEPKFDPDVHLDLQEPKFVKLLPDFRVADETPKANGKEGSVFAYTAPFQVILYM